MTKLTGSDKQIAWATKLIGDFRQGLIRGAADAGATASQIWEVAQRIEAAVNDSPLASEWINNRNSLKTWLAPKLTSVTVLPFPYEHLLGDAGSVNRVLAKTLETTEVAEVIALVEDLGSHLPYFASQFGHITSSLIADWRAGKYGDVVSHLPKREPANEK